MRLKSVTITLVAILLSSITRAAVCPLPVVPQFPDGSTASGAEMLRAKKAMETYLAELATYIDCDGSPIKIKRAKQQAESVNASFDAAMEQYKQKNG